MTKDKYKAERYDPSLAQCSKLSLKFDGSTLQITGGKVNYSYPAVSGKKVANGSFSYTTERQRTPSGGPIPEGEYWINPDELWRLEWYDFWTNEDGWGKYRVTIHPFPKTITHGRGGFFIHGGKNPGSSGCIDLTSHITQFVEDLSKEGARRKCQIHLTVHYSPGISNDK
jgi:hypothetical protein